eukprot:401285_1
MIPQRYFSNMSTKTIKEGWLKKKSKHIGSWRKRWVVLTTHDLTTYKLQQTYTNPTETIDLSMIYSIETANLSNNCFILDLLNDSKFLFSAETESEMYLWIDEIKACMRCCYDKIKTNINDAIDNIPITNTDQINTIFSTNDTGVYDAQPSQIPFQPTDDYSQYQSINERQCKKGQVGSIWNDNDIIDIKTINVVHNDSALRKVGGVWNDDIDINQFKIPGPNDDINDDINDINVIDEDPQLDLNLCKEKQWVDDIMISGGVGYKILDLAQYVQQFEHLNQNVALQYLDTKLCDFNWTKQGKTLTLIEGLIKGNSRNNVIEYFRKYPHNLQSLQNAKKSVLRKKSKVVLKYVNNNNKRKEVETSLFGIDLNAQLFETQKQTQNIHNTQNTQNTQWDDWSGFNINHNEKNGKMATNTQW